MFMSMVGYGDCRVKAEKATAVRRYRRVGQIATLFRYAEVVAVLFLLSWYSSRLPDAVRLLAVFLRRLASLVISTPFVFLLGNAIVITLFAKSSRHHSSDAVYDDFLRAAAATSDVAHHAPAAETVVYEDKAVCVVEGPKASERRRLRRTKSEFAKEKRREWDVKKLRRMTTTVSSEMVEEEKEKDAAAVMMSDEELRKRVEAFIAKEMRFRREEAVIEDHAGGDHPAIDMDADADE